VGCSSISEVSHLEDGHVRFSALSRFQYLAYGCKEKVEGDNNNGEGEGGKLDCVRGTHDGGGCHGDEQQGGYVGQWTIVMLIPNALPWPDVQSTKQSQLPTQRP